MVLHSIAPRNLCLPFLIIDEQYVSENYTLHINFNMEPKILDWIMGKVVNSLKKFDSTSEISMQIKSKVAHTLIVQCVGLTDLNVQ